MAASNNGPIDDFKVIGTREKPEAPKAALPQAQRIAREFWWRRGELNRPRDMNPITEMLDSPAKLTSFAAFLQDETRPRKAEKDPNNPAKPDRVRSIKRKPRNS